MMLSLISQMMGEPHEHECNCDMFSTDHSTDEEQFDSQDVPIINIQSALSRKNSHALQCRSNDSKEGQEDLCNAEKYTTSPTSSTFESTDSSSPREAKRKTSKTGGRELLQRVSELVEYYLSDDNLVNDMFLLKHVTKHKEGYVSLKLLSNYKKLKRVRKDWTVLVEALKNSPNLVINEEGTKVRRINKLSCELEEDTRLFRSILAYDVPDESANIGKMAEIFGKFGEIDSIQMHKPGGKVMPEIIIAERENSGIIRKHCCLIVFDKVHIARQVLKQLANSEESDISIMPLPRPKISSYNRKLDVGFTREYESAYFSASDIDDTGLQRLYTPLGSPRTSKQSEYCGRCYSPCSSFNSPRSPRNNFLGKPSPCSSMADDRNLTLMAATHNLRKLRLSHQDSNRMTPTSSPVIGRRNISSNRFVNTSIDSLNGNRKFLPMKQASSAPNSPWLRRRHANFGQGDFTSEICSNGINTFTCSPRESCLPDNVIRMPRGPTGDKGFSPRNTTRN